MCKKLKLLQKANDSITRTQEEKEQMIEEAAIHYGKFLKALGFDWEKDPHTKKTPLRVAKAWVNDLASGCMTKQPDVSAFPDEAGYTGLICQTGITITSMCAHHNLPFTGVAHIAYIPSKDASPEKMIGLSKLNRLAHYYARRPQAQEMLTKMIHDAINEKCVDNRGVAVVIEAQHMCVSCRGVRDSSTMVTSQLSGYFHTNQVGTRVEFFTLIGFGRNKS